ncbi:PrsW family intramembrane metalloprotease [Acidobacteriota bacterium]
MTIWIFISAIFAPALFWSLYLYYKDRIRPEPIRYLGVSYLLGIAAAVFCVQFYKLLQLIGIPEDPSFLMDNQRALFFLYSIGIIGVVEESFKFLPFIFVLLKIKSFDERIDGIIYASMIALGFASYENMRYLVYLNGFELFGRAFASPLTHTIFSSIWGYVVGIAKIKKRPILMLAVKSLAAASILHGLFNFFTTSSTLRFASSFLILVIWIWRIRAIKKIEPKKD